MTPSGLKGIDEDADFSGSEYTALYDESEEIDERAAQETKGWNLFREIPVKKESGSMVSTKWIDFSVKALKLLAYIVIFAIVLGSGVVSKGTLLFITSQLKKGRSVLHCNRLLRLDQQFITIGSLEERVGWLWAALIVFGVPELGVCIRSTRICFFKTTVRPSAGQFMLAFLIETLQTIGIAIMVLIILPELDVIKGAMLMNSMCFIPGLFNAITRDGNDSFYLMKLAMDIIAISAQATAFIVWPVVYSYDNETPLWSISLACILISLGWWENFIGNADKAPTGFVKFLNEISSNLKKGRYYTHRILSLWKIVVFMICIIISLHLQGDDPLSFFSLTTEAFNSSREYIAQEVQVRIVEDYNIEHVFTGFSASLPVSWSSPLWVALIQSLTCYVCYLSAKIACKILIQTFSFTFALNLVVPVTVNALIIFCAVRNSDPCAFHGTIPDYLFFDIPSVHFFNTFFGEQASWVWTLWLISQAWIVAHAWWPRCERLAATDKLFSKPLYCGPLVDTSLLMNRSRDHDNEVTLKDLKDLDIDDDFDPFGKVRGDVKPTDSITRIHVCATMWHETKDEMIEFLKSIFRLDEDQSARRVAQKYLGIVDPDYYELETHIFMDDAFVVSDHSDDDWLVNRFVKCLIDTIDEAASEVHLANVRLRPPKKYPTPYGGRLVWTLPGKTKMICHLKDKNKIRHRKRWSQVMYMYYFLGHRLMDLPISVDRKEVIAENTYLLALDGDIDFKPSAVTLLIDLMKKDKNLGAACGRIHPVGSGFMAWYQMFEYAIGHWLQKATEHMIGCVLCSPGCFSLFRGKALMDDNVMRKYTMTSNEARHYVQYDQGEDRWLCTLLLQRGYRVEYSAASDAFTHCPESFNEFFNQRRRWVPSTMANIMDLLADWKRTVKVNDNISTLYIIYQLLLMGGSILGPGTIFLMLVGALNAITGMSNMRALLINLIPIAIFLVVCMTRKSDTQLFLAGVITCLYAMLMVIVIIGIVLQILEDGWLAPSSIFTVITFGIFFLTAALHPQEMNCLPYLVIYYITIPSMYMLLIIYSLCNLNNVSWGTREVVQKKTAKEMEQEKKDAEEAVKKEKHTAMPWMGKSEETSGSIECGVAGLVRCMCCTNPKDHKDDLHLLQISTAIDKIERKLDSLGATQAPLEQAPNPRRRSSVGMRRESIGLGLVQEFSESEDSSDIPREERDDLINPYWIEDPNLHKGEVDFLTTAELVFWKDLIDTYLDPIKENKEEQERITVDLKNLRDKMVFAFVMLNALFVLVIFLLQLNQEQIHMSWPLGQKIEISYNDGDGIIEITREYLMLEPIGLLFLVLFGTIMLIQFTAMVFHRLGTLAHLLSTVSLNWYCFKKVDEVTDRAVIEKRAIDLVKDLQKLNADDDDRRALSVNVGKRRTLHNLEKSRESKHNSGALDANFKRRLTLLKENDESARKLSNLQSFGGSEDARRVTLRALLNRRQSVIAERRSTSGPSSGPLGAVNLYETPRTTINDLNRRPSGVYLNHGYEPNDDSSDEEMSPRPPRRSTFVKFHQS